MSALSLKDRLAHVRKDEIEQVLDGYLAALEAECTRGAYGTQPGVLELIPRLAEENGLLLGLCTGNLERGAELKLRSTNLWHHFAFGGYGSDAEHRPDIVRAAWKRAQERGATEGVVIDDTRRGVLAAHIAGLPAIGVATGRETAQGLSELCGPLVAESFADLERALALLTGPLPAIAETPDVYP